VHEVVATAWHGPRPTGHVVDHKDGNPANNHAENLEWVTRQENAARASEALKQRRHGEKASLTAEQVYLARRQVSDGATIRKIAKQLHVTEGTIRSAVHGVTYRHLTDVPPLPKQHEPGTWRPGAGGKTHEGQHRCTEEPPTAFVAPLPGEEWKRLKGELAGYWVSSEGRVFSAKSRRLMAPQKTGQGYLRVQLRTSTGYKNKMVHVLVAESFLPRSTGDAFIVGHLNENPGDPRAANLSWMSRSENAVRAHIARVHGALLTIPLV
jgi:DNA-binding CsgD family transcriptional regulator